MHFFVLMWAVAGLLWTGCSSEEARPTRTDELRRTADPRVRTLLLAGEEAFQRGFYQQALALADSAETYAPALADVHFFRGNVYMALKRSDAAHEAFRRVVALDPAYAGARMRMGDIAFELGKLSEALRLYKAEEAVRPHSSLYAKMGNMYAAAGVADSARWAYEQAIALDTTNTTAYMAYGQLLEGLGDYETALVYSRKALALRPNSPNYQFVVGSQLFRSGRVEEAVGYLQRAADALPLHYPAQYNLGQVLLRLGREDEARHYLARADSARQLMHQITLTEQAASHNPTEIGHWTRLGDLFHRAGMYDRAVEAFGVAAGLEPGNLDVQHGMAKTMMASGKTAEAIGLFQAILRADGTRVDVWLNLGLAYAVAGNCDEARRAWETALRYRPGDATAKGYLAGLCQYTAP